MHYFGFDSSTFAHYAKKEHGLSDIVIQNYEKVNNLLYGASNAFYTPSIIEKSTQNMVHMSVFDKMVTERILFVGGVFNDTMSSVLTAQLLYLDSVNNQDITFYIDSPGGSTKSGKTIIDVMNYIKSDVMTVNMGMSASMGSVLLSCGAKGKRLSLPFSKVMLHQVSSGAYGNVQDMRISMEETEKENKILFDILAKNTGKTPEEVMEDSQRDKWFSAEEAKEYGLIDDIIVKKP